MVCGTYASRLINLGFSLAKIGGQLGHTVMQTPLRYVNRDKTAIHQVADALNGFDTQIIEIAEILQAVN